MTIPMWFIVTEKTPSTTTKDVYYIYRKFAYNMFQPKWAVVRQYRYQNILRRTIALLVVSVEMRSHFYNYLFYKYG
jgi:hypothetical protein